MGNGDFDSNEEANITGTARRPRPWSVSELSQAIKGCLEETFPAVWVKGEISDISQPQSGHVYFAIKDANAQIRAVMWRSTAMNLPFRLQDGMAVIALGQVQVYAPRGTYQLVVRQIEPQGIGPLQIAFRQLHQKLSQEGLFDPARKKPIPKFPQRIGFVTSPSGAAIRDFLEVAQRRWRGAQILVIPARVQGPGSVAEIVAGIQNAERVRPKLDALVIGRGGGSLEDLWSFNEEAVVRAIAACKLPTVSAVGHEVDVTLADLVADMRALTPTEAAERLLPSSDDVHQTLLNFAGRMLRPLKYRAELMRSRLDALRLRPVLHQPVTMIMDRRRLVDELDLRAKRAVDRYTERARNQLSNFANQLEALSPLGVLSRGYSVTQIEGRTVTSIQQVQRGDILNTRFADGSIQSKVT